ncbi:MAG: GAF domain-containing protein [Chloroflexi bacterium]|nr:GAF domain-containing protein [Chloroflexota bacterium]
MTTQPTAHLATLYEISQTINSTIELDKVLDLVIDQIITVTEAERGFLMLGDENGEMIFHVARGIDQQEIEDPGFQVSRSVISRVAASGQPILTDNATEDARFRGRQSIMLMGLRSILCVPLRLKQRTIGVVYVDNRLQAGVFDQDDLDLLVAIANQAATTIENARLFRETQRRALQVQQVINTAPEGVILLDTNMRILQANPAARDYLEILAEKGQEKILDTLGDHPLVDFLTPSPEGLWHEITTQDNQIFEAIARPLETESEPENEEWVLIIRDVTREREIQQRAQQQNRLAAVGQLAAGIAHDFNNILAVIVLQSQMALRTIPNLTPKNRENLTDVVEQAQQATNLIQQILDFGRRSELERQALNLKPLLKELIKLLERTFPRNIRLELDCDAATHTINADPTRIQQVIMNLALNARDAMPDGGKLHFGLKQTQIQPGESPHPPEITTGKWIQMTVTDSGTGIPPDVLPHIFEPFFTTKPPGKGTGLGLAQVYGIIGQHEGIIDVVSQSGHGTTFTIYLPVLKS